MTRFRDVIEFVLWPQLIEDKIHFLLNCPKHSSIKDDFFCKIPNYKHIPGSTLIIQLVNSTDNYLNEQLV